MIASVTTHKDTYKSKRLDNIAIDVKSHRILIHIINENPLLEEIMCNAKTREEAIEGIRNLVVEYFELNPNAFKYYNREIKGRDALNSISWRDYAAIRLMDYVDNSGRRFVDPNLKINKTTINDPLKLLWLAINFGTGGAKPDFFEDMLHLFRQFSGTDKRTKPSPEKVKEWISRHPSGLNQQMIRIREANKNRIIKRIIRRIEKGEVKIEKYSFSPDMSQEDKYNKTLEWWNDYQFHLAFAIRSPELLNKMLDYSLPTETMNELIKAKEVGIPFFINPYYLSLLNVRIYNSAIDSDRAIRDYILLNKSLIQEFGKISAWEKEDVIKPGKPNAAGWLLPSGHNVHRRYPDVAILIPDTVGRACGGLCVSCQRMYDFQNRHLNFDLIKLKPKIKWWDKLESLLKYFEEDSQLKDILITGGDALMSSNSSLKRILDAVYEMAKRKKEANKKRKNGEKYAEIIRVRIGTRLPAYLPQRITPELTQILAEFKIKALKIGIRQFVIQTHFETAMEITPEASEGIRKLISSGWLVTNQLVFTVAASRRGHSAKLRQTLNKIGVLPYYTFSVKGFLENSYNFATNARSVQEQEEEKVLGEIPEKYLNTIRDLHNYPEKLIEKLDKIKKELNVPFLATDRNVLNLPGVGKSLSFRVIGITRYGKRILEFNHDHTRNHSPIIEKMGKVTIIESKQILSYLKQLKEMGEDISEYENIYGYSIGETEMRMPIYDYPEYDFQTTKEITNLQIDT